MNLEMMPGEHLIVSDRPHWWYFWKQVAAGIGLAALVFLAWSLDRDFLSTAVWWVTAAVFVVWAANTLYEFVQWRSTHFVVTNQRVAYQGGLARRAGVSIPLNRVNNVNFQQGMIARVLNNGTITIESAGESSDSVFENIPHPEQVRSTIFTQMRAETEAESDRNAQAIADAMSAQSNSSGGQPGTSVEQRLDELKRLREQGMVTNDEYAERRARILDDL